MIERHKIGKEKAIEMAESGWWKDKSAREICDVQLFIEELCMDFSSFHKAVEDSLGRAVWTHEFGLNFNGIVEEYLGQRKSPSLEDIMNLIPKEKLVVISVDYC